MSSATTPFSFRMGLPRGLQVWRFDLLRVTHTIAILPCLRVSNIYNLTPLGKMSCSNVYDNEFFIHEFLVGLGVVMYGVKKFRVKDGRDPPYGI